MLRLDERAGPRRPRNGADQPINLLFHDLVLESAGLFNSKLIEEPSKRFKSDNKSTLSWGTKEIVTSVDLEAAVLKMVDPFIS